MKMIDDRCFFKYFCKTSKTKMKTFYSKNKITFIQHFEGTFYSTKPKGIVEKSDLMIRLS